MEAKNLLFTHDYSLAASISTMSKDQGEKSKDLLKI
jgi:hypothetical protein